MTNTNFLWKDRKRTFLGLPLSFTKYRLTEDKLLINTGVLATTEEEIKLYRIMDLTLKRTLFQRLLNLGTIHCCSADKTTPEFLIRSIKNPVMVKELLSNAIDEQRTKKNVTSKEFLNNIEECDIN